MAGCVIRMPDSLDRLDLAIGMMRRKVLLLLEYTLLVIISVMSDESVNVPDNKTLEVYRAENKLFFFMLQLGYISSRTRIPFRSF